MGEQWWVDDPDEPDGSTASSFAPPPPAMSPPAMPRTVSQATPTECLKYAAAALNANSKLLPMKATWSHLSDGLVPFLDDGDRCEAVMPMNVEFGADPSPKAGLSNVKPTGKVDLTLACIFQDKTVFLHWSGLLKLKYDRTVVEHATVQSVSQVEFMYKMNTMLGFEVHSTAGRLPVLGNDPYKYPAGLLACWNSILIGRLRGHLVPVWDEECPLVDSWSCPGGQMGAQRLPV